MTTAQPPTVCQRVREQISLQLDNELSQLEQRMLASHLARCSTCDAYAAEVSAFTSELRSAPLLPLERPIVVRRQRRITTARLQVGVAAAFALAAVGIGSQLAASEPAADFSQLGSVTRYPTRAELDYEMRLLESLQSRTTGSNASVVF
jgi:anti-sigma factor RsiW